MSTSTTTGTTVEAAMDRPRRVPGDDQLGTVPVALLKHRQCWIDNPQTGIREPTWPCDPDVSVVLKIAVANLPLIFASATISPFSMGAFHKLYRITSSLTKEAPEYIMRVAIPVEPFFKTESEVATMEYVRKHTTIRVPKVVAFSSSAGNELGFEWILMEKLKGVAMFGVWERMPLQKKVEVVQDLEAWLRQLRTCKFPLLGNIYFAGVWSEVGYNPCTTRRGRPATIESSSAAETSSLTSGTGTGSSSVLSSSFSRPGTAGTSTSSEGASSVATTTTTTSTTTDIGIGGEFVVGHHVCRNFWTDKRLLLHGDRGPFGTAFEMKAAETHMLGQRMRHLSHLPGSDYYCGTDVVVAREPERAMEAFEKLEAVLPGLFPVLNMGKEDNDDRSSNNNSLLIRDRPEDAKVLWHNDISRKNVLVDPETYKLVAIVDWESASVVPIWDATVGVPGFISGPDVFDEPPSSVEDAHLLTDEEERKQAEADLIWKKDNYLRTLLRTRYYMPRAGDLWEPPAVEGDEEATGERVRRKKAFAEMLEWFERRWGDVDAWLAEHGLGGDGDETAKTNKLDKVVSDDGAGTSASRRPEASTTNEGQSPPATAFSRRGGAVKDHRAGAGGRSRDRDRDRDVLVARQRAAGRKGPGAKGCSVS